MSSFSKKNNLIQKYSLLVIDVVVAVVSFVISYLLRYGSFHKFRIAGGVAFVSLIVFCVIFELLLDWNHYIFKRGFFDELMAVLKYDILMLISVGFSIFALKQGHVFSRILFGILAIVLYIMTYMSHILFKKWMYRFYRRSNSADKVLVITESTQIDQLMEDIQRDNAWSYRVTELIFTDKTDVSEYHGIPVSSGDSLAQHAIDVVLIHLPDAKPDKLESYLNYFETMGVECNITLLNLNRKTSAQSMGSFAGHVVATYSPNVIDYRRRFIKRLFDIIGAIIGLMIAAILTPFIALAIAVDSRGPILYSQIRVGKNGRRFKIYKFRSMYKDADARKQALMAENEMSGLMFKMENDPRITRVGRFLRKTSLDELPQFYNILRGDMSLIGTRPPTEEEFEHYNAYYRRRLSITPGLSGLWQVSGRSDINDFDEVVKLDLEYIDNWSLSLDFKILLQTIAVVAVGRGSK